MPENHGTGWKPPIPPHCLVCPFHEQMSKELQEIKNKQFSRHCEGNEVKINKLEKSDDEQWTRINSLTRLVYIGAGAAGFLGSLVGHILTYLLTGHK